MTRVKTDMTELCHNCNRLGEDCNGRSFYKQKVSNRKTCANKYTERNNKDSAVQVQGFRSLFWLRLKLNREAKHKKTIQQVFAESIVDTDDRVFAKADPVLVEQFYKQRKHKSRRAERK